MVVMIQQRQITEPPEDQRLRASTVHPTGAFFDK